MTDPAAPFHRMNEYLSQIDGILTMELPPIIDAYERKITAGGRLPNWADVTPLHDLLADLKAAMLKFEGATK